MPSRSPEGDALTALVLPAFELNGEFLAAAEMISMTLKAAPSRTGGSVCFRDR